MLQCSPGQRRHRCPAQGCHCLCRRRCHPPPPPPLPLPSTCSVRISDRHKSPVASSIHHTSPSQQNLSSLSVCKIFYLHIFLILILHCIVRLVTGDFCPSQTGSTCAAAVAGVGQEVLRRRLRTANGHKTHVNYSAATSSHIHIEIYHISVLSLTQKIFFVLLNNKK